MGAASGEVNLKERRRLNRELGDRRRGALLDGAPPRSTVTPFSAAEVARLLVPAVNPSFVRPHPADVAGFGEVATRAGLLWERTEARAAEWDLAAEQLMRASQLRGPGAYLTGAIWTHRTLSSLYAWSQGLFAKKYSTLAPKEQMPAGPQLARIAELPLIGGEERVQRLYSTAAIAPNLHAASAATRARLEATPDLTYDLGVAGALGALGSELIQMLRQTYPSLRIVGLDSGSRSGNFGVLGGAFDLNNGNYPVGPEDPGFGKGRELNGAAGPFFPSDTGARFYLPGLNQAGVAAANADQSARPSGSANDVPADLLLNAKVTRLGLVGLDDGGPVRVVATLDDGREIELPAFIGVTGAPEDILPFPEGSTDRATLERLLRESTAEEPRVQTAREAYARASRAADPLAPYRDQRIVIVGGKNSGLSFAEFLGRTRGDLGLSRASMGDVPEVKVATGLDGPYDCVSYLVGDDGLGLVGQRGRYSDVADLINKGLIQLQPEDVIGVVEEPAPGRRVGLVLSDRSTLWADRVVLATGIRQNNLDLVRDLLPAGTDLRTPIEQLTEDFQPVLGTLPDGNTRSLARQLYVFNKSGQRVPVPIYFAGLAGGDVADADELAGEGANRQSLALFLTRLRTLTTRLVQTGVLRETPDPPRPSVAGSLEPPLRPGISRQPLRLRLPEKPSTAGWTERPQAMDPFQEAVLAAAVGRTLGPLPASIWLARWVSRRLKISVSQGRDADGRYLDIRCGRLSKRGLSKLGAFLSAASDEDGSTLLERLWEYTARYDAEVEIPLIRERDSSPQRAEAIRGLFEIEEEDLRAAAPADLEQQLEALSAERESLVKAVEPDVDPRAPARYRFTSQGIVLRELSEAPSNVDSTSLPPVQVEVDRLRRRWGGPQPDSTGLATLRSLIQVLRVGLNGTAGLLLLEAEQQLSRLRLPPTYAPALSALAGYLSEMRTGGPASFNFEKAAALALAELEVVARSIETDLSDLKLLEEWLSDTENTLAGALTPFGNALLPQVARQLGAISRLIEVIQGPGRLTEDFARLGERIESTWRLPSGGLTQGLRTGQLAVATETLRRLRGELTGGRPSPSIGYDSLVEAEQREIDRQIRARKEGQIFPLSGDVEKRLKEAEDELAQAIATSAAASPTARPPTIDLPRLRELSDEIVGSGSTVAAFYRGAAGGIDPVTLSNDATSFDRDITLGQIAAELTALRLDGRRVTDLELTRRLLATALDVFEIETSALTLRPEELPGSLRPLAEVRQLLEIAQRIPSIPPSLRTRLRRQCLAIDGTLLAIGRLGLPVPVPLTLTLLLNELRTLSMAVDQAASQDEARRSISRSDGFGEVERLLTP